MLNKMNTNTARESKSINFGRSQHSFAHSPTLRRSATKKRRDTFRESLNSNKKFKIRRDSLLQQEDDKQNEPYQRNSRLIRKKHEHVLDSFFTEEGKVNVKAPWEAFVSRKIKLKFPWQGFQE